MPKDRFHDAFIYEGDALDRVEDFSRPEERPDLEELAAYRRSLDTNFPRPTLESTDNSTALTEGCQPSYPPDIDMESLTLLPPFDHNA